MKLSNLIGFVVLLIIASACKNKSTTKSSINNRSVYFDKASMDTTVNPGDNFFLYASGNWIKHTDIPATEATWGSFYTLANDNQKNIKQLVEALSSKNNTTGSPQQMVNDLYVSGMDTIGIEI